MNPANLGHLTIVEAAQQFRTGTLQPETLIEVLIARIDALDDHINAWVSIWRDKALSAAYTARQELCNGYDRGPLHGIPIGVKDIIDVAGYPTLADAPTVLPATPALKDATLINRLRQAGAIFLGKTHTHPFAMGTITPGTFNPWNLAHIPGGSSGGSAAALAAGMCLGALGSDTGGSIRLPAGLCGITGLKPTYGLVSRRGVFPLAWTLDHLGPLARSAEDCGLLLAAIAGYDSDDPRSLSTTPTNPLARKDAGVHGMRIGLLTGYFAENLHPSYTSALQDALRLFEQHGATISEIELPFAHETPTLMTTILPSEAATIHRQQFLDKHQHYHPTVVPRLEAGLLVPAVDYLEAQRVRAAMSTATLRLFSRIDVMVAPVDSAPAPRVDEHRGAATFFTAPFNLTGLPVLTLPCGFTAERLPLGMQIIAPPLQEATAIQVGCLFQQFTDWHRQQPPLTF